MKQYPSKMSSEYGLSIASYRSRYLVLLCMCIILVIAGLWIGTSSGNNYNSSANEKRIGSVYRSIRTVSGSSTPIVTSSTTKYSNQLTTESLLAMTEDQLEQLDPLIMNLTIAKEIPDLQHIEIEHYVKIVDDWAARIAKGLNALETQGASNELVYKNNPDLWRAGSMAVAIAGRNIGISYTAELLDAKNPDQLFLPGLIDTRTGTCSNMPVLFLAMAHRLQWPLKGVVSGNHFWCRWDDGSNRFNLEATSASTNGSNGSFLSTTDEEYIKQLSTPQVAVDSGSDFTSLTRRQLLGVFLQTRAGYWSANNNWDQAEHDLLLARTCFPENRDIHACLMEAMAHRAGAIFSRNELQQLATMFLIEADKASRTSMPLRTTKDRKLLDRNSKSMRLSSSKSKG